MWMRRIGRVLPASVRQPWHRLELGRVVLRHRVPVDARHHVARAHGARRGHQRRHRHHQQPRAPRHVELEHLDELVEVRMLECDRNTIGLTFADFNDFDS